MNIVNEANGEVVTVETKTYEDLIQAWEIAQSYEKMAKKIKDALKPLVTEKAKDKFIENSDKKFFRISHVQRYNYDKSILRQNLDEDTFDTLLIPDKPAIDRYIKENLESLGPKSTIIRNAMLPVGKPYEVIKLERLS